MKTQETKHGYFKIGIKFYNPDPRFNSTKSRRIDEYKSKTTGEVVMESMSCVDENDKSNVFVEGENGPYNSECYACYIGIGHTVNKHNSAIN